MEILGHTLVDMREAPDAQVVRSGSVSSVPCGRTSIPEWRLSRKGSASWSARAVRHAHPPRPGASPVRGAPRELVRWWCARRHSASEAPATPGRPADVARRPSLGAVRRNRGSRSRSRGNGRAMMEPGARRQGGPAVAPRRRCAGGDLRQWDLRQWGSASALATLTLDHDSLTEAWGDGILQSLRGGKGRYASGRFVSVDRPGALFALPMPRTGNSASNSRPMSRKPSPTTSERRSRCTHVDDTGAPPAAGPGPSPAASTRSAGAAPPPPVSTGG